MQQVVMNPNLLNFSKENSNEIIEVVSTFYGDEYTNNKAYMKFNNAIKRMGEPREVEQTETDVEFVTRNEAGSIYAVVYHYPEGGIDSDMLTRRKNGGWLFHRSKVRFRSDFVRAYIHSIYGYRKVSELQIAQDLAVVPSFACLMRICKDKAFFVYPGGIYISNCVYKDGAMLSVEAIDFVPYEAFKRDEIKDFYQEIISRYASEHDFRVEDIPDDVLMKLEMCSEKLRKKA